MASDPRRPDGDPERPLLCAFWEPQRWRTYDWWDVVLRPYCEAPALDFLHSQTLRAVRLPSNRRS